MDNIFIGWSGNEQLAKTLCETINDGKRFNAFVGGGIPARLFIGDQVFEQIESCDYAIFLVERFAPNIMLEIGYVLAKMPISRVFFVLINKSERSLPSDIGGIWVFDKKTSSIRRKMKGLKRKALINGTSETLQKDVEAPCFEECTISDQENVVRDEEKQFANEIYEKFYDDYKRKLNYDDTYFNFLDRWEECFTIIKKDARISTSDCERILVGCLAAYYYDDYDGLYRFLVNDAKCDGDGDTNCVRFAIAYITVFKETSNMGYALGKFKAQECLEVFEDLLTRKRELPDRVEEFFDMLIYDICALTCLMYLRNSDLSTDERAVYQQKAENSFKRMLRKLDAYKKNHNDNMLVARLLEAYIYSDMSLFYEGISLKECIKYGRKSVKVRKELRDKVACSFPDNEILAEKIEQEYYIAVLRQISYEKSSCDIELKDRLIYINNKLEREWRRKLDARGAMLARIEGPMKKIKDKFGLTF